MAAKKVPIVVMHDYRKPDSFVYDTGTQWSDFLYRWNDRNITTDEAKGLLHVVADRLWWADLAPERIGEDSRETCVRFLLYYADYPYRYDCEWQIIEKARKVLIYKVLNTSYIEKAPNELVMDILTHLVKLIRKGEIYSQEPYRRKIEDFLRMIGETRNIDKINDLVNTLIAVLFRNKHIR